MLLAAWLMRLSSEWVFVDLGLIDCQRFQNGAQNKRLAGGLKSA